MAYTKTVYVNEVLPSAERFDIKENGGGAFKANMQIVLAVTPTTVGTAVDAAHLNNAENQIDALSTVPAWTAPTLLNSWANAGGSDQVAGYYKDIMGVIYLRGIIMSGASNSIAFTLPSGYRPTALEGYAAINVLSFDFGQVMISPAGDVAIYFTGTSPHISICGITFRIT